MSGKTHGESSGLAVSQVTIQAQLNSQNLTATQAAKYASYLWNMYGYIRESAVVEAALNSHDVYEGAMKAVRAAGYTGDLNVLIRRSAALKNYAASGGASVLGVFVDRFAALARSEGIELNECALSFTKVVLDIGGAGTGAVSSAFTGPFGVLLLGVSILDTFKDSLALGNACSPG